MNTNSKSNSLQKIEINQKPIKSEMNGDISSASNLLSANHKSNSTNNSTKILSSKMNGIKISSFPGTTTRMTSDSTKKEISNVFSLPMDSRNSAQNSVQCVEQTNDQNCIIF